MAHGVLVGHWQDPNCGRGLPTPGSAICLGSRADSPAVARAAGLGSLLFLAGPVLGPLCPTGLPPPPAPCDLPEGVRTGRFGPQPFFGVSLLVLSNFILMTSKYLSPKRTFWKPLSIHPPRECCHLCVPQGHVSLTQFALRRLHPTCDRESVFCFPPPRLASLFSLCRPHPHSHQGAVPKMQVQPSSPEDVCEPQKSPFAPP